MSSAVCPNTNPVTPPETNNETKPIVKSIGVAKRMRAPHNVPNQLKVLTADGTPMTRVERVGLLLCSLGIDPRSFHEFLEWALCVSI